jgi:ankyrin repeat protein
MARTYTRRTATAGPHCTTWLEGTFISEEGSSVVQLLIERGADVNKRDSNHQTPLHLASHHQHLKPVQVLLDHGANVNAEDSWAGPHCSEC